MSSGLRRSLYNSSSAKVRIVISLFQFSSYESISLVTYRNMFADCARTMCVLCVLTWHHTCEVNLSGGGKKTNVNVVSTSQNSWQEKA